MESVQGWQGEVRGPVKRKSGHLGQRILEEFGVGVCALGDNIERKEMTVDSLPEQMNWGKEGSGQRN